MFNEPAFGFIKENCFFADRKNKIIKRGDGNLSQQNYLYLERQ
jgi:hypothetical protein